jgi:hypothetical protein
MDAGRDHFSVRLSCKYTSKTGNSQTGNTASSVPVLSCHWNFARNFSDFYNRPFLLRNRFIINFLTNTTPSKNGIVFARSKFATGLNEQSDYKHFWDL